MRRLGDLIQRPQYGLTASATKDPHGPRFLRITDIQESGVNWSNVPSCACDQKTFERVRLLPGDLVIARIGATTGKAHLIREHVNALFASYLIRLRGEEGLDSEFLYNFTNSSGYRQQIDAVKGGRLKQGVNIPLLESLEILLPPLPEQRAIAAVLRTVQGAKEACERVLAATRQLKQSLLYHLFTYGPVPFPQAAHVPLKETEMGRMPERWNIAMLGDFAHLAQYGLSLRGNPSGRYPILRMNNLQDGKVVIANIQGGLQYVELDDKIVTKFRLAAGDLLFNRTNSFELVGKTSLFEFPGDFVFASYIVRLQLDSKRLDPRFANYCLNMPATQARLKFLASRGVSQSNINATKLKGFEIPLPPLPEQREIVAQLSAVDAKLAAGESRRSALVALFQSLLHYLMTGHVRLAEFAGGHTAL